MKTRLAPILFVIAIFIATPLLCQDLQPAQQPHLIGYWKFQDKNNLTKSTVGSNLLLTGKHEWVKGPAFGDTAIRIGIGSYYTFTHKIKPNGGGTRVNQYTLMFDFKVLNFNKWHTFFQIDSTNKNDGECFIRPKTGTGPGRIGVAATSYTQDSINPNQWYRLMISVNNGNFYRYYLNGQLVLEGDTQDLDGRFSLGTQILFFADENQEDDTIDVGSVAMFDTCLSTAQIAAIGTIEPCIANPPKPNLGRDTLLCAGQSITKNAGSGYTKYFWSTGAKSQSAALDLTRLKMGKNTVWVKVTDPNLCEGTDTVIISFAPNPIIKLGQDTAICAGHEVTLNAGTDTSYQYLWKYIPAGNTLSNKDKITVDSSGIYTVRATSFFGCIGKDTIQITVNNNPPKPTITVVGNASFCEGDSAKLETNAGYAAYYWNEIPGNDRLVVRNSDTFYVQVQDQNGCRSVLSDAQITTMRLNPKQIILNHYKDTFFCDNDSLVFHVNGYPGYLWSDGSVDSNKTIKKAGNYSLRVKDLNGCISKASNTVYVTALSAPGQPGITPSGNQNVCDGDSVVLSAPAGFVKYLWNDLRKTQKISAQISAFYMVKVMNAQGCFSNWSAQVQVTSYPRPAKPSISIAGKDSLKCIELYPKYRWWSGAIHGTLPDSGATIAGLPYQFYQVQAFNGHCWSAYSDSFLFVPWTTKQFQIQGVQLFPNPVMQYTNVTIPLEMQMPVNILIYDMQGRLVYAKSENTNRTDNNILDLSALAAGTYHIVLRDPFKNAIGTFIKQ